MYVRACEWVCDGGAGVCVVCVGACVYVCVVVVAFTEIMRVTELV